MFEIKWLDYNKSAICTALSVYIKHHLHELSSGML